jgi:hypothetical protein
MPGFGGNQSAVFVAWLAKSAAVALFWHAVGFVVVVEGSGGGDVLKALYGC